MSVRSAVSVALFAFDHQRAVQHPNTLIGLYLTGRITQEVTDVRNDFTERQTLRSKPANTTNT